MMSQTLKPGKKSTVSVPLISTAGAATATLMRAARREVKVTENFILAGSSFDLSSDDAAVRFREGPSFIR